MALEGDEGKVNLKIWVPILVGVTVLASIAVGFGMKSERLDSVEKRTTKNEEEIGKLQELKTLAPRIEKSIERLEVKMDKIIEQKR